MTPPLTFVATMIAKSNFKSDECVATRTTATNIGSVVDVEFDVNATATTW